MKEFYDLLYEMPYFSLSNEKHWVNLIFIKWLIVERKHAQHSLWYKLFDLQDYLTEICVELIASITREMKS